MGLFSCLSSALDSIKSTAYSTYKGVKSVASKVIDTCIEFGGKVVDTVKEVYKKVKPYIAPIKKAVKVVGDTLGMHFPWIKTASDVIYNGLDYLENLEKSPLVKKILEHIEWALKTLKDIKEKYFKESEIEKAEKRQKELEEAMSLMKTEEHKLSIRFAALINDYILVRSRINKALENFETDQSTNFEYYLRLTATQKLLKITEHRLKKATDLSQISDDDLFLIQIGSHLLSEDPQLSEQEALRLDKIISRRFNGKSLLPFVFEELLFSWNKRLESMKNDWERKNSALAKIKYAHKKLTTKQKTQELSFEEQKQLENLQEDIRLDTFELRETENKNRAMENYIYAAEGFLQVLEKKQEEWEEEKEWILDDSAEVGMLLIQCIEQGVHWDDLTKEQQSLIVDFANIFAKDSQKRTKELEQEWNSLNEIEVV
ncbi:hypothetical protein [Pasteurella multocida]|uniref:hypothetical protein n=1 Tax=Pasteurella multocida TaxID=747 RepID=UPI000F6E49ED|nr:hypothetical protein [Pasteurella multocida]VEJ15615.1 Uncharacterised protein [Pasteurella multocida subsp. septica]HEA3247291.1 hypothetical protein [Pasteurella multocida]